MAAINSPAPAGCEALGIPAALYEQMRQHVSACLPEEACGLLAGQGCQALAVFPVLNELHSPQGFRMQPQEQLAAFEQIDDQGWELLAIYHSHPGGPPHPSATDLAEFRYPGVLYLIWSPAADAWRCLAYRLKPAGASPEARGVVQQICVVVGATDI